MEKKNKKKRITHIGNEYESTGQNLCLDLVNTIMESMNTSLNTVTNSESARRVSKPVNKSTPSSSNDSAAQAFKIADAKFKKLSVARKFPLMEKSQKVLKQIKHNRSSIPKPRAHLQSTEKPPKEITVSSIVSQNKKKPFKPIEKTKGTNVTLSKYPNPNTYTVESNLKQYIDKQRKIAREKSNVDKNTCTKINPFQPDIITNHISQSPADDNSHDSAPLSHTTDSEYEKFIEKIVPKHKKKPKKIKKANSKKSFETQKSEKKSSAQYDSDFVVSDNESASKTARHSKPKTKLQNCINEETKKEKEALSRKASETKKEKEALSRKASEAKKEKESSSRKASLKNRKCKQANEKLVTEQNNSSVQDSSTSDEDGNYGKSVTKSRQIKSNSVSLDNAKGSIKTRKTTFENKNKHVNNLRRSSSSESLVEQYDSNVCDSDSSDNNQNFNDTAVDSELFKSNAPGKDNVESFSASSKDADNSESNLEAVVHNETSFSKEADFIPRRYSLRSKNYSSGKVGNVEMSCAVSSSNLTLPSEVDDHTRDLSSETSVIKNVTGINLANNNSEEPPNKNHDDLKDAVVDISGRKDSRPFIPFDEFCGSENSTTVEQSQKSDSDESDIEIIYSTPFSGDVLSSNPVTVDASEAEVSLNIVSDSVGYNQTVSDTDTYKNMVCKIEPDIEIIYSTSNSKGVLNSNPVIVGASEVESSLNNISDTVRYNQTSIDTYTSKNAVCKMDSLALDDGRIKRLACNSEVIKEEIEKHDPVYMTNICQDVEGGSINVALGDNTVQTSVGSTSAPGRCVAISQHKSAVEDDNDEIMVIEPNCEAFNIKQENKEDDDDIIVELEMKVPPKRNIDNPATNLICKRKEYLEHLENNIRNEYPLSCKIPKIASDQISASLIEKELALFKYPEASTSISRTNFDYLLSKYKTEFNVYKEIRQTEASVEAGLKLVEAHQAQKLQEIRSEIQKVLMNDPHFDKIYNETVKGKEKISFETPKIYVSPKISLELSCENSSDSKPDVIAIADASNSTMTSENSSDSKPEVIAIADTIALNPPMTFIKVENNDLSSLDISSTSFPVDHSNFKCKVEVDTLGSSSISHSALVDEKPEMNFLGQKCNACGKDAVAACQRCAKVFFCSNKCGQKFWNGGHKDVCSS